MVVPRDPAGRKAHGGPLGRPLSAPDRTFRRPLLPVLHLLLGASLLLAAAAGADTPPEAEEADSASAPAANAEAAEEPEAPATTFLDAVSVTATRSPTSLKDAPGSVSVLEASRIERELSTDPRDLVRYEPGIYVEGDPTRLGLSGFNVRGIGGNRVLTRVDGVPTAEEFTFGPLATTRGVLDLDAVESVEIVKNAGSALYGSDALGGVVSVVTKDPADYLAGERAALRLRAGFDGRDGEVSESATGAFGGARWQGSMLVTRRDGDELSNQGDRATADATRTASNPQDRAATGALGKLVYAPGESSTWKLGLEVLDGETETEVLSSIGVQDFSFGFPPGAVFLIDTSEFDAVDEVERQRLSVERSAQRQGGLFDSLLVRLYAQEAVTEQRTRERRVTTLGGGPLGPVRSTPVIRTGLLTFEQETVGAEAQAIRAFDSRLPARLTYGLAVTRDRFDQLRDRTDVHAETGAEVPGDLPFPTKYFPASEVLELGAYVQAELELAGGRVKLVPGLRWDRFDLDADQDDPIFVSGNPGSPAAADLTDSALSPRLALLYAPTPAVVLHAQYARGFRAPPFSDVNNGFTNLASGYTTLPNPDLEPETSDNFELGVRAKVGRGSFSLALFDNRYDDFIETVSLGFNPATGLLEFQPRNLTAVRIRGVELAGDVNLSRTLRLRGAFSWIDGEDVSAEEPLNSIAPAELMLGLGLRAPGGRFGAELVATVVADKDEDDLDLTTVDQFAAPGYEVLDLLAFYEVTPRLGIQLSLLNLTDETYWEWANVRGVSADAPALGRYTSPGFAGVAALAWRF